MNNKKLRQAMLDKTIPFLEDMAIGITTDIIKDELEGTQEMIVTGIISKLMDVLVTTLVKKPDISAIEMLWILFSRDITQFHRENESVEQQFI